MAQKHPYGLYAFMVGLLFIQAMRKPKVTTIIIDQLPITEFPGYKIHGCKYITYTDINKAYIYAYTSGTTTHPDNLFIKLFGSTSCLESIGYRNINEAQFMLNLLTYFLAGSVFAKKITLESSVIAINGARDDIAAGSSGYNLSPITAGTIQGIISKQGG